MQRKTIKKLSGIVTIIVLILCLWAVRTTSVTAQIDINTNEDSGSKMPPEQYQEFRERMGNSALLTAIPPKPGINTNEDSGSELPPEQRQVLLDQMGFSAFDEPTGVSQDCTIGTWNLVSPVNTPRSRSALTYSSFSDRFYLIGGEATGGDREIPIEEYDPTTDTWTDKTKLLTGVSNTGAAAIGQYIYIPGGYSGSGGIASMQRYNIVADTLTTLAPMTSTLFAHAVVALNNKVYVLGGSETGSAGTTNRIYDVAANNWQAGEPLPVPVNYAAAVTDGYYVYVMGGSTSDLTTVQRYNPQSDSWTLIPDLSEGRGGTAGFFDGKNVWVVGGGWSTYSATTEFWDGIKWQSGPSLNTGVRTEGAAFGDGIALKAAGWIGGFEDDAEILSVECAPPPPPPPTYCTVGEWQDASPINTPRSRLALTYASSNGHFYMVGGEAELGNRDIPIEEYDPVSDIWIDKSNLLIGVSNVGAVAVGNYIYVPGGYTGSGEAVADLQRYNIQNNTVVTKTAMPAANFAHAVTLFDNKLHVLGGSDNGNPGFTHFVYDIATDSWDNAAPLPNAVNYAAASSDATYIYLIGGGTFDSLLVQRYDPATDVWTDAPILDSNRGGPGAFFDGSYIWAVGGGWYSYLTSTEYFDGYRWRLGPSMNVGARTVGAAFGNAMALKAGGWANGFVDSAEILEFTCTRYVYLPAVIK